MQMGSVGYGWPKYDKKWVCIAVMAMKSNPPARASKGGVKSQQLDFHVKLSAYVLT